MLEAQSLTGKRWVLRMGGGSGEQIVQALAQQRGIDCTQSPSWEHLSDPMLLGEMPEAIERIERALEQRETIGIIGDYDADGITGTAQLVRFFRRKKVEPHVILPHRERHGYGVKKEFIDALQAKGVTLLLTVDTGIGNIEEIAYARSLGMDVIILDHHALPASQECMAGHAPSGELPNAILLHPSLPTPRSSATCPPKPWRRGKQSEVGPTTDYQLLTTNLSGSGIAFTLLRALENELAAAKRSKTGWEEQDTDIALTAIGTVGDVVPLLGENRLIVQLGLEALNRGTAPRGIDVKSRGDHVALREGPLRGPIFELARSILGNGERLTSSHLAYRIAPRINAAGRIADPALSLKVLLEGGEYLEQVHAINARRQLMTEKMMEVVLKEVDLSAPILACTSPLLHIGIIGLLASKLTSRYERPCIVGHERNDGLIVCSLRSVPSYNIVAALGRCSEHLSSFGGHEAAAGCTLERSCWRAFIHALQEDVASVLGEEPRIPTLRIDAVLSSQDVSPSLVRGLQALEPYGAGNPEPLFLLERQTFTLPRRVGRDDKHFQCFLGGLRAVGFGLGHLSQKLPQEADVAVRLRLNSWNGSEQVQIVIEDIAEPALVRV